MFYKFCYVFIGFGFLFISIRIFANKKFERFAIEYDFSSLGDTYVIPAIISLAASFAFFYLTFRSTKNIKKYPEYLVCLKCKTTWWFGHLRDKSKCNFCGGEVMDASKYGDYIRKIEFLEKRKKGPKIRSVRNKRKKDKGNVDD